jgi:hypothetical protein
LVRLVAAPAGVPLTLAAADAAATLAVWRHDALADARAANARPMRVLAPLLREQIQVIVRNDAPWDYLRQIRGLRLNIGRSDGARARTARTLYRQLFGEPLPAAAADDLDEGAALQRMLRRGGPIDAMIVVSEVPLLNRLPATARDQLRELPFDANDPRAAGALRTYPLQAQAPRERPRLTVTSFLVTGAAPHPNENTLRQLAIALCQAQPTPWPYVLPRSGGSGCPTLPPATDPRRDGAAVPARPAPHPS